VKKPIFQLEMLLNTVRMLALIRKHADEAERMLLGLQPLPPPLILL
jgi:hypothetical protein